MRESEIRLSRIFDGWDGYNTHDVHHGGELALMLGMQGLAIPELGDLFGHITMPPLVGEDNEKSWTGTAG